MLRECEVILDRLQYCAEGAFCQVCDGFPKAGHNKDCELGVLLARYDADDLYSRIAAEMAQLHAEEKPRVIAHPQVAQDQGRVLICRNS